VQKLDDMQDFGLEDLLNKETSSAPNPEKLIINWPTPLAAPAPKLTWETAKPVPKEGDERPLFPLNILPPLKPDVSTYPDHIPCRLALDDISKGEETISVEKGGKTIEKRVKRNPRLVVQEMYIETLKHLRARGEFFTVEGQPYYLDRADSVLMEVSDSSPELAYILRKLGYMPKNGFTPSVQQGLIDTSARAPKRTQHRISYMSDDAIYLNAGNNRLIEITIDTIREVPVGTNGVILIADDIAPWPSLAELEPLMKEMHPKVGHACTKLIPELPLTKYMTTRWSHSSLISATSAHQLYVTRLLFMTAASRYSLWPETLFVGDSGSGKSTPNELMLVVTKNDEQASCKSLPGKEDSFIASLLHNSIAVYDNIDGARLDDPQRSSYFDLICQLSTGAEIDMRTFYTPAGLTTLKLKGHGFFTCRFNPLASRDDVMRRTILLQTDPAPTEEEAKNLPTKDDLRRNVMEARPAIITEIILRSQNILRAHLSVKTKHPTITDMRDYEVFTLLCAEYEGTLPETRLLWRQFMEQYRAGLAEHNPLARSIQLWLGKKSGANVGREVSSATLFGDLKTIYQDIDQQFPYRSPVAFGRHIQSSLPSLRALGYATKAGKNGPVHVFHPDPQRLGTCMQMYEDFRASATDRIVGKPNSYANASTMGYDDSDISADDPAVAPRRTH
jgi:hypothetical protein